MGNLLQEAIADANRVKELAYENAKTAIEEAFQPRIQRMISSRLAEDDFEDELTGDPTAGMADPMAEPDGDEFGGMEDDVPQFREGKYIDDGKDGVPAEDPGRNVNEDALDEDFNALIKELEDEMAAASVSPVPEDEFGDGAENPDDVTIEAIARGLREAEKVEKMPQPKEPKADGSAGPVSEVVRLRQTVSQLTREHKDALRALSTMKSAMNEVNLLNAKLMFSSKIMQRFDLTESQQVKILETFDRATSVREVKLIYTAIHENYQSRQRTRNNPKGRVVPGRVTESASRPIQAAKKPVNESYDFANRWKVLAGLKPIND